MLSAGSKPAFYFGVVLLFVGCLKGVEAQDEGCYTSGSVAGIVIATIVVTIVMGGLAAAFVWYIWRRRKGPFEETKVQEKSILCPPMSPDKQLLAKENNDYAFDNPYFKDDDTEHKTPDSAEKGESGFHLDNGGATPALQQNAKQQNGTNGQSKKSRPFSSLPFHSVFHPSSGKKQKTTMDDTYISKHLERITVPLRGHDFTGLGFNICGNMRDGIFVKDVLHRGPASESGKIKAGDKIIGVTVSFSAMVYEDALTILSYASPYDVKLEIEKCPTPAIAGTPPHLPSSSPKKLGASTSFRSGGQRRLFHPLYRSQSIDDLTQIGKDIFLGKNSPNTQKESSAAPKRSQSVETNSIALKTRLKTSEESATKSVSSSKGSRKSSTSSCDSTGKIVVVTTPNENIQSVPPKEETPCVKKEVKSSRFRVEQINVKTDAPVALSKQAPPVKPARDTADDKPLTDSPTADVTNANQTDPPSKPVEETVTVQVNGIITDKAAETETDANKPVVPPRKISTPKRKAPAPPPTAPTKTETSAVVHRADEKSTEQKDDTTEPTLENIEPKSDPPPPLTSELPEFIPVEKITAELDLESSDNCSVISSSNVSHQDTKEEPSSPEKRKASSLGDLTKLETKKKTSISSAILERAVSLDLQQSMPGENLVKQKKVLRAPTFDNDYDEDRENDVIHDTDGTTLKRWDDFLDKALGLPNGEIKFETELSDHVDESQVTTDEVDNPITLSSVIETEAVTKKLMTVDIDLDSSNSETTLQETLDSEKHLTSTPIRKIIEVKSFLRDDDELDDVPYLASAKEPDVIKDDELSTTHSNKITTNSVFSPVTISIPVIKPDLTNFEKLPSPPPASTHPSMDTSWKVTPKTPTSEENNKFGLERISVQSLYKPIFSSKEVPISESDVTEKMVNGNDSDSSEHYNTANESSMESHSVSTVSVTMSPISITSNSTNVTIKTPNSVAGFAKTLIIPGPNEVENLLSLAAEPNTPPPQLDPPPKPVENE